MRICFKIGGKWVCIDIPLLIERKWWEPEPDPRRRLQDWIEWRGLPRSVGKLGPQLSILATVAELAELSEGRLKEQLTSLVRAEAAQLQEQLPDVKIELGAQQAKAR